MSGMISWVAVATAATWLVLGAFALAAASTPVTLTGIRSYSGPTATRLVFDFSGPVAYVAPDSGVSDRVLVTFPAERIMLNAGIDEFMRINDGVVDSLAIAAGSGST